MSAAGAPTGERAAASPGGAAATTATGQHLAGATGRDSAVSTPGWESSAPAAPAVPINSTLDPSSL
jgi:hypothetical protein